MHLSFVAVVLALLAVSGGITRAHASEGFPGRSDALFVYSGGVAQESKAGRSGMTVKEFIGTTPGGPWMPQLLVSFCVSVMVLWILRFSVVGLLGAAIMLPVSAYVMAAIGFGNYWLPTFELLMIAMPALGWRFLTRRTI